MLLDNRQKNEGQSECFTPHVRKTKEKKKLINQMKGNAFEHRKDQKEIELWP